MGIELIAVGLFSGVAGWCLGWAIEAFWGAASRAKSLAATLQDRHDDHVREIAARHEEEVAAAYDVGLKDGRRSALADIRSFVLDLEAGQGE